MRMYIVGSVASGKSTLARQLSARTGVPCVHLDDVVYEPDSTDPAGNRKRPEAERGRLFQEILAGDFLIEDTGRAMFEEGLRRAEQIVVLEPHFGTPVTRNTGFCANSICSAPALFARLTPICTASTA